MIESQVARRDPSIAQLARQYNSLCEELNKLKVANQAPVGAVCPEPLEIKGLFNLDVDSPLWVNMDCTGLEGAHVPRWLGDENVRCGIRAMLEMKRCKEELERIKTEYAAMQSWSIRRWGALHAALDGHCIVPFYLISVPFADDLTQMIMKRVQLLPYAALSWYRW